MPSWCMPICTSWSAAVLPASGLHSGMLPATPTGSPHMKAGTAV
jgi:hypothetical protein